MRLRIFVKDPSEKNAAGGMMTKAAVFVRLNQPYEQLRKDRGRPISQAINDAIVDITDDWQVARSWDNEPPPTMKGLLNKKTHKNRSGLLSYSKTRLNGKFGLLKSHKTVILKANN